MVFVLRHAVIVPLSDVGHGETRKRDSMLISVILEEQKSYPVYVALYGRHWLRVADSDSAS